MPEGVACPRCSLLNQFGGNFCSACGAELPEGDDVTGTYPQVGVDVPDTGEVGQLVITRGATAGAKYALDRESVSIGRHPDSEIFLDDVTVSRHHARVLTDESGQYRIEDAGSLNGTYLDGERVDSAQLREGAQIQVGKFRLVFVIGSLGDNA